MNKMSRRMTSAGLALLACAWLAPRANAVATSSATLNIEVTVVSNLSVKVNSVASSTDVLQSWNTSTPNQFLVSPGTATVLNDSGAQTEKWGLSTLANSIDQGTGGSWSLSTNVNSVGADQFAVQAVFGSATTPAAGCPATTADDWNNAFAPALTAGAPVTYKSTVFADTALNNGGANTFKPDVFSGVTDGRMLAGSQRALCWRTRMPLTTSTIDPQTIMVIVSALNP